MARNLQKYRYGGMVVEVFKISEDAGMGKFKCLVRGYGHNNKEPRKEYDIQAETNAKASRLALQKYKEEFRYGSK